MKESTKAALWIGGTLLVIGGGVAVIVLSANKTQPATGGSPGGGPPPASTSTGGTQQTTASSETILVDGAMSIVASAPGVPMLFASPSGTGAATRTSGLFPAVSVTGDLQISSSVTNNTRTRHFWFAVTGTTGKITVLWSDSSGDHTTVITVNPLVNPGGVVKV